MIRLSDLVGSDLKIGIAISMALPMRSELNPFDMRLRTAGGLEPLLHHVHLGGRALDVAPHCAIRRVHAPAAQAQSLGLPQDVPPEVDALHFAKHLKLARIDLGRHGELALAEDATRHTIWKF